MADFEEIPEDMGDGTPTDFDIAADDTTAQVEIPPPAAAADDGDSLPFQVEIMEDVPARLTYIDYLRSPTIGLLVGQGDEQALLTAHQALLVQSPWFADACAKFSNDVSVSYLSQKGR